MTIHIETGKRFGKLVAVELATPGGKNKSKRWVFDCDCGIRMTTYVYRVNAGIITCCRACKFPRRLERDEQGRLLFQMGQRFNKLTVIEPTGESKRRKKLWLFQCDCGSQVINIGTEVASGMIKSCGCNIGELKQRKRNPITGGFLSFANDEGESAAMFVWKQNHYADDGCPFDEFLRLSQLSCHYCGDSPTRIAKYSRQKDFIYNGLDRLDSSGDHSPDNLVPCCWFCNSRKGSAGYQEFIDWVRRVNHHLLSA